MLVLFKSREISLNKILEKSLLIILIFFVLIMLILNFNLKGKINYFNNEISSNLILKKKYQHILRKDKIEKSFQKNFPLKNIIIKNIIDIPDKMNFNYIFITEKKIEIRGFALSKEDIFNYFDKLKINNLFNNVSIRSIDKNINYQFFVEAYIAGGENEKQ